MSGYDIDPAQSENPLYKLQWMANKHLIWFFIIGMLLILFVVMKRFFG